MMNLVTPAQMRVMLQTGPSGWVLAPLGPSILQGALRHDGWEPTRVLFPALSR